MLGSSRARDGVTGKTSTTSGILSVSVVVQASTSFAMLPREGCYRATCVSAYTTQIAPNRKGQIAAASYFSDFPKQVAGGIRRAAKKWDFHNQGPGP